MAISEEILKIKPKNTRVKATSREGEYDVILRTSVWDKQYLKNLVRLVLLKTGSIFLIMLVKNKRLIAKNMVALLLLINYLATYF